MLQWREDSGNTHMGFRCHLCSLPARSLALYVLNQDKNALLRRLLWKWGDHVPKAEQNIGIQSISEISLTP